MDLQRRLLSLLFLDATNSRWLLLAQTYTLQQKYKRAVFTIESYVFRKKVKRNLLLKKCDAKKMILIQKFVRGWLCRVKHAGKIKRAKYDGLRKTKGYQMAQKIQSHVRGYLFRNKRAKALKRLQEAGKKPQAVEEDDLMMNEVDEMLKIDKEFDAEEFFDVRHENLVKYPNLMMDQAIEAMSKHLKKPLPPLVNVPPGIKQNKTQTSLKDNFYGTGGRQPKPIDDISEIDMMSDTNRSTTHKRQISMKQNNLIMNESQYSHGPRGMAVDHQSSRGHLQKFDSETISNYSQSQRHHNSGMARGPVNPGGLPGFHPGNSTGMQSQESRKNLSVQRLEERKKIQEEWGWENEQTVELWQARAKARKGVKKKTDMTAAEKLARFQKIK